METEPRKIEIYRTRDGKAPYTDWYHSLNIDVQKKIYTRMKRVIGGNVGDHHSEGKGVWALIFDYGPGYRIYYGLHGNTLVLLLNGGSKKRQNHDIALAQKYWEDYKAND